MTTSNAEEKVNIFINYRRKDTEAEVGRLRADLKRRFGSDVAVFQDLYIKPGKEWPQDIRDGLNQAEIVLVVIGKKWLTVKKDGLRRLDDKDDWVRLEIEEALKPEARKLVIPILVQNASAMKADLLPQSIKPLFNIQALRLRPDPDWEWDFENLCQCLLEHPCLQSDTEPTVPVDSFHSELLLWLRQSECRLAFIRWLFRDPNVTEELAVEYTTQQIRTTWCDVPLEKYLNSVSALVLLLKALGLEDIEARSKVLCLLKILVPIHSQKPIGTENIVFEIQEASRLGVPIQVEVTPDLIKVVQAIRFPDEGEAIKAGFVETDDQELHFVKIVADIIGKPTKITRSLLERQAELYKDEVEAYKELNLSVQDIKRPRYLVTPDDVLPSEFREYLRSKFELGICLFERALLNDEQKEEKLVGALRDAFVYLSGLS